MCKDLVFLKVSEGRGSFFEEVEVLRFFQQEMDREQDLVMYGSHTVSKLGNLSI